MALNDTRLRTLKPKPGKSDRLVADGNGLYIRIRAGEGKITRIWQFRRREAGDLTVTTLGTYPALPLQEARRRAIELATKRQVYSPTVAEAAERWLREQVDPVHKKPELIHGYVTRAILPAFGDRRISDLKPAEIADAVREYGKEAGAASHARQGGVTAARVLLAVYKTLFKYCVTTGWLERSPAAQLTGALAGPPSPARTRVLTDDEILMVLTTDIQYGPVLRFLLATGLRISEAYNGHREGQYWLVPSGASKNKAAHRVWLSDLALAQLERQPWAPARTVQEWVTDHAGGWTAHDLRRTFSTRINGMGVAPYVVEKMLNHSFGGVMAVYNHATYDAERRQALEAWSAWLAALVAKQPADVVSLRQVSQQAA